MQPSQTVWRFLSQGPLPLILHAAPVVLERDVERLMQIADPVAPELQDGELRRVPGGHPKNLDVSGDRGEQARIREGAQGGRELGEVTGHVDDVLLVAPARIVRPRARLGERAGPELLVDLESKLARGAPGDGGTPLRLGG